MASTDVRQRWSTATAWRPAITAAWRHVRERAGEYRAPLAAYLVHLVLVFAAVSVAVAGFSAQEPTGAIGYTPPPMTGPARYLIEPLANWDGQWYSLIALHGYWENDPVPDPMAAAFWPLYPLLLRAGRWLTGWEVATVGVLLSNGAFLIALALLYRLVRLEYGAPVAKRAVWALALCPMAFFFSAVYTESLFLLCTVGAIYYGRTGRWGRAAALGFLGGLTRNTGVLVLLPLGWFLLRQHGWDPRRWWAQGLQVALIALAPLLFMGYQARVSGDFFVTVHVQRKFTREMMPPWQTVRAGFREFDPLWFRGTTCVETRGRIGPVACVAELRRQDIPFNATLMLAVFLLLPYLLLRVRPAYSLYTLAGLAVPLSNPWGTDPFATLPRFAMVLFPLFIALALLLRHRWLFGAVLALSALAMVGLLIQFSTWFFVI